MYTIINMERAEVKSGITPYEMQVLDQGIRLLEELVKTGRAERMTQGRVSDWLSITTASHVELETQYFLELCEKV